MDDGLAPAQTLKMIRPRIALLLFAGCFVFLASGCKTFHREPPTPGTHHIVFPVGRIACNDDWELSDR